MIAAATELLIVLTDGAWGVCEETLYLQGHCHHSRYFQSNGATVEGVRLGYFPLVEVTEAHDGDDAVPTNQLSIRDGLWVLRHDGGTWNTDGTSWLKVKHGNAPSELAKVAASRLACELTLACTSPGDCALPEGVQQLTRQGVSMVLKDPFAMLADGRTNIYEVDLLLMGTHTEGSAEVFIPGRPAPTYKETWHG